MSYYKPTSFNFSGHGLLRCKQRLEGMQDKDEFEIKREVNRLIKQSTKSFETRTDAYISAGNTNWYFVFKKDSHLLVTYTKVSPQKQLEIETKGYYE